MKKNISGQGLIEALIIFLFVGAGIAAILSFQNYLMYSTSFAQQQSDANLIAIKQMETLRDFTVINTTTGYSAYQDIATNSDSTTVGNTTYTINWTITASASPAYKTASVVISWTDNYGNSQSVTLVSNIASLNPAVPGVYM